MGLGAFACGVGGAKKAFGGFGAFEAWQTAGLNANIKSYYCGLGAFACGVGGAKKAFGGSTNFACGVGMPLLPWQATKEPSSTPPVVAGAAPAMAKAGVGGYHAISPFLMAKYIAKSQCVAMVSRIRNKDVFLGQAQHY